MTPIDRLYNRAAAQLDQESATVRDWVRSLPPDELCGLQILLNHPERLPEATLAVRERVCVLALNTVLRAIIYRREPCDN